jgi:hypothetical protein
MVDIIQFKQILQNYNLLKLWEKHNFNFDLETIFSFYNFLMFSEIIKNSYNNNYNNYLSLIPYIKLLRFCSMGISNNTGCLIGLKMAKDLLEHLIDIEIFKKLSCDLNQKDELSYSKYLLSNAGISLKNQIESCITWKINKEILWIKTLLISPLLLCSTSNLINPEFIITYNNLLYHRRLL